MFRDDQQATALQNEQLLAELDRLQAENGALRQAIATHAASAVPLASRSLYRSDPLPLSEVERVSLGVNGLEHFPVWLAVLLHVLTFGCFSVVYYASQGARLPAIEAGDPGATKGVGFFFIPYFNLYWLFAFPTRLADRLNLQLKLRGERPAVSQALMVGCALSTALILVPFFWVFAVVQIQRAINRVVALGPVVPRQDPYAAFEHEAAMPGQGSFEQAAPTTGVRVDSGPSFADLVGEELAWRVEPSRDEARR